MKIAKRIGCTVLTLVLVCVIGMAAMYVYFLIGTDRESTQDISYYRALSGQTDGADMIPIFTDSFDMPCPYDLPLLDELEPYEDYRFNYTAIRESIFQSHAYVLIVTYDEQNYQYKKGLLTTQYEYLETGLRGENEELASEFQLDGFEFRAVDGGDYLHEMFFVGTSDSSNEIAYVYYHDQDLDYISPSVSEFIKENSGWNELIG